MNHSPALLPLPNAVLIPRSLIVTRHQPRGKFQVDELRESIKEHGILQPLIVREGAITKEGERGFWLVAGERRLRASDGMIYELPCIIREGKDASNAAFETLVENVQREDLDAIDEARFMNEVMKEQQLSPQKMGVKLGKSRKWVYDRIALLTRGADVQGMVQQKRDTFSVAATIDGVTDKELREHLITEALSGTPSRSIEAQVQVWKDEIAKQKKANDTKAPDTETQQRQRQVEAGQTGSVSRGLILQGATATRDAQAEAKREITTALTEAQARLMHARSWIASLPDSEKKKFASNVGAVNRLLDALKKDAGLEI